MAQRIINDHQVRLVLKGSIYGVRLSGGRRTYIVPHADEHFSERSGEHDIVLNDEDTQRLV